MTAVDALPPSSPTAVADRDVADGVAPGQRGRAGFDRPSPVGPEPAAEAPRNRLSRPLVILPVVAAVLAAVLAVTLSASSDASGPGAGEAIVTVHGEAFVARADGTSETVTSSVHLHPGDRIDIRRGRADFQLARSVRYEGLAASGRIPATSVSMGRVPRLESGRLLIRAPEGTVLRTSLADVRLRQGSIARVLQSYAVTVSSYRGTSVLSSAGVSSSVTALRSVQAAAAGELARRRPIDIVGDRWDRTYLAEALQLDRSLVPVARVMRSSGVEPVTLLEATRISVRRVPGRAVVADAAAGRPHRLDDAVGLAIVANSDEGSFRRRWERVFDFHDAGASWGLTAMDVGADPDRVLADLDDALDGDVLAAASEDAQTLQDLIAAADLEAAGRAAQEAAEEAAEAGGSGTDPTDPGGTGVTVPPVTTPDGVTVPTVTTPGGITVPTVTTPGGGGLPGVTTPTIPGVTTPAVPAVPVIPGVTTPAVPSVPIVPGVVTTVTGVLTTLLPGTASTTTTTRPRTTTTTTPLVGCVLGICI